MALSHKRLQEAVLKNFINVDETKMNLTASSEAYRERMNRLEIACQRQSAINFLHTSITLDPDNSSTVDMAKQLINLVLKDIEAAKDDKEMIQQAPPLYSLPNPTFQDLTELEL